MGFWSWIIYQLAGNEAPFTIPDMWLQNNCQNLHWCWTWMRHRWKRTHYWGQYFNFWEVHFVVSYQDDEIGCLFLGPIEELEKIVIDWGWLITNLKLSVKAREPMTAYKRCSSAAVREQKKQMSHNLILNFKVAEHKVRLKSSLWQGCPAKVRTLIVKKWDFEIWPGNNTLEHFVSSKFVCYPLNPLGLL